ncbi:MAG: putative integral rane protein [Frankiales bacterium]|nr:putative integral rane protein [Frankiales bacterium]
MRVEGLLFAAISAFLGTITAVYWLLSRDPTGTTALALSGGLAFIIGYYLLFTSRRMDARPEDRPDAEIGEGAGEVGFFAPHSWWPILLAGSFSLVGMGLIFGRFMLIIGAGAIAVAIVGFTFEFYLGINRTQANTIGALEAMGESPTSVHKFLGE